MRAGMKTWTGAAFLALAAVVVAAAAAQPPGRRGGGAGRGFGSFASPLQRALDADNNGELSSAELENAAAALKKLDKNADGKVSRDEMLAVFSGRRGPGGIAGPAQRPRAETPGELSFESSILPKDDTEKKILAVLNDMDQNQRRGMMNVPEEDGRLLRLLAEAIGAKHVVEIGASNGYSGIWFSLALRTTGGKLTTHELDPGRASLARKNFQRAGVQDMITLVEGDAHQTVKNLKEPIDLLFLDADKEGYIDYLQKLLPLVRPGGLIVAHNMNVRQADPRYVKAITTNPRLETLFLHMEGAGVGVSMKKR